MPKIRMTVTATMEYDADPEHYEAGSSPADMVATDAAAYEEDPMLFLDNEKLVWTSNFELVDAG